MQAAGGERGKGEKEGKALGELHGQAPCKRQVGKGEEVRRQVRRTAWASTMQAAGGGGGLRQQAATGLSQAKPSQVKSSRVELSQGKSSQVKASQVKSSRAESRQGKARQGKAGE
eukprot:364648-Chlamydomonas_euryale.AAC.11